MKRKITLFLSALAVTLCAFALLVGASDIYSDFTEQGANGEDPIFSFLGYSASDSGGIGAGYTVNHTALKNYEATSGEDLRYGIVVTLKDLIEDEKPLDDNGLVPEENKDKVIVIDFSNAKYSKISVSFTNMTDVHFDRSVIMSLFVVESTGVKYIGEETTDEGPESISYNDVILGKPATPAVPPVVEVTIGGMTYSVNGVTEQAWDRIRQQNASNADYNTGSSMSSSELTGLFGVKTKAQMIAAGGSLINMPMASALMNHYLKNTGETYNIDVASFLKDDSGALKSRNNAINNALRASEQLARKNKKITVNQLAEGHPMQGSLATQNWQYAIGSYFDDVDIINLTVTEVNGIKTYSADIKYIVTDYYNWDTNDYNKFKGIVSPHDLHELHKAGIAREFLSYGEITYTGITWTEGQTVDQIAGLN